MNIYIDAENISYKEFDTIKNHYVMDCYKILSMKVYGDWNRSDMQKWYELCKKYSIDQKQCISNPKKGVVDFNIVIDIMDDVYNDMISKNNVIRKILIVSSDSDFIHIHNRIVKTGIEAEIFSPISFHTSKYKIHDTLFTPSSSITLDNNNIATTSNNITIMNPEKKEEYLINSSYENSHSYFVDTDDDGDDGDDGDDDSDDLSDEDDEYMFDDDLSDEDDDEDDDAEYNTYNNDNYYKSLCNEETVNKMKHNIGICFKWINKRNDPTRPVNEQKFINTYKLLESNNMFDKIHNVDNILEYLSHFKLIEYIIVDNFKKIKINFPLSNSLNNTNELTMCYRYQNKENLPVLFSTFVCNIYLLKGKNIIKFKFVDKQKLKQQFLANKIPGFVLIDTEKKKNKKVKKMLYVKKL